MNTAGVPPGTARKDPLIKRLLSRRGAVLLARNTAASTAVFAVGLGVLWWLVERLEVAEVPAVAGSFLVSNSLHYMLGRSWVYQGTERAVGAGYAYFLLNAVIGLVLTIGLFAGFTAIGMHYIVARVVASVFVGLVLFVLNAVFNFRSI